MINGHAYTFDPTEWIYPPEVNVTSLGLAQGGPGQAYSQDSIWELQGSAPAPPATLEQAGSQPLVCWGTFLAMDLREDMFLVGDIFMRKYYTVFDRDNDRVGLAEAV